MSSEKNFFKQVKASLNKSNFIQKIENKYNSGFPDLIIITETLPLFIELKALSLILLKNLTSKSR